MISAARLLDVWERGQAGSQLAQAVALLTATEVGEEAIELPVGLAVGQLMTLREALFGSRLSGVVVCPDCEERLELDFRLSDIRAAPDKPFPTVGRLLEVDGWRVRFRLPTYADLVDLAEEGERPVSLRERLLARCLLAVEREVESESVRGPLPEALITQISEAMDAADPQADTRIAVTCHACATMFESRFDIVSFLWGEVETWARRLLAEVHVLASAYGWREADILDLSPARRHFYLEMIRGN
jgi:hypothetical protein